MATRDQAQRRGAKDDTAVFLHFVNWSSASFADFALAELAWRVLNYYLYRFRYVR